MGCCAVTGTKHGNRESSTSGALALGWLKGDPCRKISAHRSSVSWQIALLLPSPLKKPSDGRHHCPGQHIMRL